MESTTSAKVARYKQATQGKGDERLVPGDKSRELCLEMWGDLCVAQASTLKAFTTFRNLLNVLVRKLDESDVSHFGSVLFAQLKESDGANSDRAFSRRLFCALECEGARQALKAWLTSSDRGFEELLLMIKRTISRLSITMSSASGTVEDIENVRDGERLFDGVCRIGALYSLGMLSDASLSLFDVLSDVIVHEILQNSSIPRDIHLLRSGAIAYWNVKACISTSSLHWLKSLENPALDSRARSALVLGILSCPAYAHMFNLSKETMAQVLDIIMNELKGSSSMEESKIGSNHVDRAILGCEALCAWSTRVARATNSDGEPVACCTPASYQNAIEVTLLFLDHRDSSVQSICSNTFERLLEARTRIERGTDLLGNVFSLQWQVVSQSGSAANARRGIFAVMNKLIRELGAKVIDAIQPKFISRALSSALRDSNQQDALARSELGNGLCNMIVTYLRSSMTESDYKLSKQAKQDLLLIGRILVKGSDDLFASYFVSRHLLSDLLGEARSTKENDAIREIAKALLTGLGGENVGSGSKRKQRDALEENNPESHIDDNSLWARLSILLALERGGNHVLCINDLVPEFYSPPNDNVIAIEASLLRRALRHESEAIREHAWALCSTRVKRSRFPEALVCRLCGDALPFIIKGDGLCVRPSLLRFVDRIQFALEKASNIKVVEDEQEDAKHASIEFIQTMASTASECIYPDAPFERVMLALELILHLLKAFPVDEKGPKVLASGSWSLLKPILLPGTVRSMIETLRSQFDAARSLAFECLKLYPAPLPGFETRSEIEFLLRETGVWRQRIFEPRRRDADSSALLCAIVFEKYISELGWELTFLPNTELGLSKSMGEEIELLKSKHRDAYFMRVAEDEARKCVTVPTAYDVGCVIVDSKTHSIISKGFSRELPGNTHAEECALRKLGKVEDISADDCASGNARGTIMYTTMEPCSLRLSGNRSCASRTIAAGVSRVVVGVKEPDKFVQNCEGWILLESHGIKVESVSDEEVLRECSILAKNDHTRPLEFDSLLLLDEKRGFRGMDLSRNLCASYFFNNLLDNLEHRLSQIKAESDLEKRDQLVLHGLMMACKYIVRQDYRNNSKSSLLGSSTELVRALKVARECMDVSVETLASLEVAERQKSIANVAEDDEFLTKTTTWLTVREGSDLIKEILESLTMYRDGADGVEIRLRENSDWFLQTVLGLRHLGAMSHLVKGFEGACKLLFQSADSISQRMCLDSFVPFLLERLGVDAYDKALRRTEGFALAFRAIARAAHFTKREDVVDAVLASLLSDPENETDKRKIARLNVLHFIFDDAALVKSVAKFIATGLTLALTGFLHPSWGVRNSSLNLFVALLKRAVGEPNQAVNEEVATAASTNSHTTTTARLFFEMHPSLLPFLLNQLEHNRENETVLHPIVLLLSSLRRDSALLSASVESQQSKDPAAVFVPKLREVALQSPTLIIRSLAARAIAVLEATLDVDDLAMRISNGSNNARHGALLELKQWLIQGIGLTESDKERLKMACFKVVASESENFILRDAALDACSLLSPHELLECTRTVLANMSHLADETDGPHVGRKRFLVHAIQKHISGAVSAGDAEMIRFAIVSCGTLCVRGMEHLVHILSRQISAENGAKHPLAFLNAEQVIEMCDKILVSTEQLSSRDELTVRFSAARAIIHASGKHVILSTQAIKGLKGFLTGKADSLSVRGTCALVGLFSTQCSVSSSSAATLLDSLQELSDPERSLELRLACADALGSVLCHPDETEQFHAWVCAVRLMQDGDAEVREHTRLAVSGSGRLRESGLCLEATLRESLHFIAASFAPDITFQALRSKLLFGQVDDTDQVLDDDDDALFKADRANDYEEPFMLAVAVRPYLAKCIARNMRSPHLAKALNRQSLAEEAKSLLTTALDTLRSGVSSEQTKCTSIMKGLIAVELLGNPLDEELCRLLHELRRDFTPHLPWVALKQLVRCEERIFGQGS